MAIRLNPSKKDGTTKVRLSSREQKRYPGAPKEAEFDRDGRRVETVAERQQTNEAAKQALGTKYTTRVGDTYVGIRDGDEMARQTAAPTENPTLREASFGRDNKSKPVLKQPDQKPFLERTATDFSQKADKANQESLRARVRNNFSDTVKAEVKATAYGLGSGLTGSLLYGKNLLFNPGVTVKQTYRDTKEAVKHPITTLRNLANTAANKPGESTGNLLAAFLVGKGVDKGVKATGQGINELRFLGKTEQKTEDIVSEQYLSGKERYPKAPPKETVDQITEQGDIAYQASPTRIAGGDDVKALTQADKVEKGLDLSETGGIYGAPKLSPQFLKLSDEGNYNFKLSLVLTTGNPGSVQRIKTKAARLPKEIRESGNMDVANAFLDEKAAKDYPGVAFTSPASEILGKTESEVIIPGGSTLERTKQYPWWRRATGTDFDEYVRVPKKFPKPGEKVATQKVAIRDYRNIGAVDDVSTVSLVRNRQLMKIDDYSPYTSSRPASGGALSLAGGFLKSSAPPSKPSTVSNVAGVSGSGGSDVERLTKMKISRYDSYRKQRVNRGTSVTRPSSNTGRLTGSPTYTRPIQQNWLYGKPMKATPGGKGFDRKTQSSASAKQKVKYVPSIKGIDDYLSRREIGKESKNNLKALSVQSGIVERQVTKSYLKQLSRFGKGVMG